jgi:hypothetical protein
MRFSSSIFFLLLLVLLLLYLRNHCLIQNYKDLCFLENFYYFYYFIRSLFYFETEFCIWHEFGAQLTCFASGCPGVWAQFITKTTHMHTHWVYTCILSLLGKTVFFFIDFSWYFCWTSINYKYEGFFWGGFSILFHWSMSVLTLLTILIVMTL